MKVEKESGQRGSVFFQCFAGRYMKGGCYYYGKANDNGRIIP
mgnify:CR=1 FL=1